ncbi:MAG: response regulator, partial [Myxococcaceae bacterium]
MSRILIVEDEQDLANLLTYNLSAAGFETETSHTGAAALSRAKTFKPDLVLLDLMLPDLPGSEVLRLIKEDPNLRRTAVVMVTAKGQESDRVQGLEAGADDYVVKPFSVRELATPPIT